MTRYLAALMILCVAACADPPPVQPAIAETFSRQAQPTEAERREVIRLTYRYFSEIAEGRLAGAYNLHTLDFRDRVSLSEWQRQRHGAWAAPPRPVSIRWQKGMHRVAGPELYAVVEWSGRKGATGSTGRLIWRQEPDGGFLLENSETRVLIPK